jgi:hypothetical protein
MIYRPFAPKALGDIDATDLARLISDQIPEGLFVEYKRDWTPRGAARSIASFANNTGGGTLIIGVEANKLLPIGLVGLQNAGDLEERVVSTVRTSIAPVPSFTPRAVDLGANTVCLVVEIPEGLQPPYILVRTGQILIRTPTSSEPVGIADRDALDPGSGGRNRSRFRNLPTFFRGPSRRGTQTVKWTRAMASRRGHVHVFGVRRGATLASVSSSGYLGITSSQDRRDYQPQGMRTGWLRRVLPS